MKSSFSHITWEQRKLIRRMLDENRPKTDIARAVGSNRATIYREIERGSVDGQYDPDYAERAYRAQLANKGAQPILSANPELAQYIADLILVERLSLTEVLARLREQNRFATVPRSRMTLYAAIDHGLIPGVTRESLNANTVSVSPGGQIRIALWARNQLNIREGDTLRFEVKGQWIRFCKVNSEEEDDENVSPA